MLFKSNKLLRKSFGADFDLEIRDSLSFVSENMNAIMYPVGHHIAIRDLFVREDLRKNDIIFIYNDNDVKKITAMKTSKDNNLLLVCEKKQSSCCISIYNLTKPNFNVVPIIKPKRKIISTLYDEFISACFSIDGNYIACIASVMKNGNQSLIGILWDIQVFQPFKEENYKVGLLINSNLNFIKSPDASLILILKQTKFLLKLNFYALQEMEFALFTIFMRIM